MNKALSLGALLILGCASSTQQTRAFPTIWPGSAPLTEDAPTVSIQPITLPEAAVAAASEEGIPTPAVLTALFIKHLHATGVNAVLEQAPEATAPYSMQCTVPKLGYTQKSGYPEQFDYQAELVCTLSDTAGQQTVWKRSLQQRYETAALFNMFSKIPEQPNTHDRIIYKECIVPLWDAMAGSVRSALISKQSTEHPETSKN